MKKVLVSTLKTVLFVSIAIAIPKSKALSQIKSQKTKSSKKYHIITHKGFEVNVDSSAVYENPDVNSKKQFYLPGGNRIIPLKTVGNFYYVAFKDSTVGNEVGWILRKDILEVDTNFAEQNIASVKSGYLSINDIVDILHLRDHSISTIMYVLSTVNDNWLYKGQDSGEVFFLIDLGARLTKSNQFLDWHIQNQEVEYLISSQTEFLLINNQIQANGFKFIKSQTENDEVDKVYSKGNVYIITAKIKLKSSRNYSYKIIAIDKP